jgi:RNA 3'-terminal phosphate cyclase (ATP)
LQLYIALVNAVFEVDGSQKSGSGTILRLSVALAAISGQPLHIYNIRSKRPQAGLKPQHLEAVLTAAKLCNAETKGAVLQSRELWFAPSEIRGGNYEAEIGTAGSIPMLLLTVLPICVFAKEAVRLHISKGGTDTWSAPTINYMRFVFLPALERMGLNAQITVHKYGYYPKGMGEVTLTVEPCPKLAPFRLENFGNLKTIKGVSVCTFLSERNVAQRQAKGANEYLAMKDYSANIEVVNDTSNPLQKGSSIVLWAETDKGVVLGADAIGELGKPAEKVGMEAAEKLLFELTAKPTVDVHLADMLILYVALADGFSVFLTRKISDHLEANIWLAEKMLGAKFKVTKAEGLFKIERVS